MPGFELDVYVLNLFEGGLSCVKGAVLVEGVNGMRVKAVAHVCAKK